MYRLKKEVIQQTVCTALKEDVGPGDITTNWIAGRSDIVKAVITAQADGIVAGGVVVKEVFRQLNDKVRIKTITPDGTAIKKGEDIVRLSGPARAVLTGERTALNYLGMLSGIATKTNQFVLATKGTKTNILDTRKTTPGLRHLVKYAVSAGQGTNHRIGLYDAVLIKDNHIQMAGSLTAAINKIRHNWKKKVSIEVEVENLKQVDEALACKADILLLDNLTSKQLQLAIKRIGTKAITEVSGGIELRRIATIAKLGVDRISVGAITHSAPWLPLHMEFY